MIFDVRISSVGFEGKDRVLVVAGCVTEDIVNLLIEKYGNAANIIDIERVTCDGCDEE